MPFYDFRCTKCGHTFEEMQSVNAPNPPCPNKDANEVEQGGVCCGETVKVPVRVSWPQGGPTPVHYRRG